MGQPSAVTEITPTSVPASRTPLEWGHAVLTAEQRLLPTDPAYPDSSRVHGGHADRPRP